jgi:hypothetical protein
MPSPAIKSEEDFKKSYDRSYIIPQKIRTGIAKLKAKNGWCENKDFMVLCDIKSPNDLAAYREPFLDHVVLVPNTDRRHDKFIWCGSKALAEKLRAKL